MSSLQTIRQDTLEALDCHKMSQLYVCGTSRAHSYKEIVKTFGLFVIVHLGTSLQMIANKNIGERNHLSTRKQSVSKKTFKKKTPTRLW